MRRRIFGGIYFVAAMKNGEVEYWAAATLQENAVEAVQKQVGAGWLVTLTEQRLTDKRLSVLKMGPNTVRKL
jgi:hypothetical protein